MEVLATIGIISPVVQAAYSALQFAWKQYNDVDERKAQCKALLKTCQDILDNVSDQLNRGLTNDDMNDNLRFLESACVAVNSAIANISGKGFAWRLLHQDSISLQLSEAEKAVSHAYHKFNINAHLNGQRLQSKFASAREHDHSVLVSYLKGLAESDQKILEALQADGKERRQLQELVVALTKHIQNQRPTTVEYDKPAAEFVQTANMALQRLSNRTKPMSIPRWTITSLDVLFDRNDDRSCIGRGAFGRIYKGEWHGQIVAVKEMHWEDARALNSNDLKEIRREISIWSQLAHPHILPFYGACLEAAQPFMVTKLCQYGNTLEFLRTFPQINRNNILNEIALGMNHLHISRVIHADLKACNVLIADDGKALIADFGLSRFQDQVSSRRSNASVSGPSREGSLRWMSPERLDGSAPDKPSDVYSFAITAWELFTGDVPFAQVPDRALIRKIVDKQERPNRPPLMENDSVWNLVQQSWNSDPEARPSFDAIILRLKPLSNQSSRFSVIPGVLSSGPGNISSNNAQLGLPSAMGPGISPVPSPSDLPTSNTSHTESERVGLHPGARRVNTQLSAEALAPPPTISVSFGSLALNESDASKANDLARSLLTQLSAHGPSSETLSILSSVESLTRSDEGRIAVYSLPNFFFQFQRLLLSGSPPVKEKTLSCIVNLAWNDEGKQAILARPDIISCMIHLLWQGSTSVKIEIIRCLGRILTMNMSHSQTALLVQPRIIQGIQNLLQPWSSLQEKEQAARCLARLSCNAEGQTALISQPDLLPTLVNVLPHGTPDAKQNVARCLANIATSRDGQAALIVIPGIISALSGLLLSSSLETEQALRCLQYLTYAMEGQELLINEVYAMAQFSLLLGHESSEIRKYVAGCCRNLCHTVSGVHAIFTQSGLPYALKTVMSSGPPEAKDYAMASFFWIIHHCMDLDTPLDALPVRYDRHGLLLALEYLLHYPPAQEKAAACLRRLCSLSLSVSHQSYLATCAWVADVGHRPSLLKALANPSLKTTEASEAAAHCLAYVALRADTLVRQSFFSQPDLISNLATIIMSPGSTDVAKIYVIQCLTALAASDRGQRTLNQYDLVISALQTMSSDPYTSTAVKAEISSCLRNLNRGLSMQK